MRSQRFSNYCDKTFTLSKGCYLILTLSFLMYIPISVSNTMIFNADIKTTPIYCYFLLYPFLALLGDRFIRYRVVLVGTILIAIGTAIIFSGLLLIIIAIVVSHYFIITGSTHGFTENFTLIVITAQLLLRQVDHAMLYS